MFYQKIGLKKKETKNTNYSNIIQQSSLTCHGKINCREKCPILANASPLITWMNTLYNEYNHSTSHNMKNRGQSLLLAF